MRWTLPWARTRGLLHKRDVAFRTVDLNDAVEEILRVTATDAQLVSAMRFFVERMKLVVEPTGCLAAAVAFEGAVPVRAKRVGVILSGGTVDPAALARHLAA